MRPSWDGTAGRIAVDNEHDGREPESQELDSGTQSEASAQAMRQELERQESDLKRRDQDLIDRLADLRQRSESLHERSEGSDVSESELDERRREFMRRWAEVEEDSAELRSESDRLDKWRQVLEDKQQKSREAAKLWRNAADIHAKLLKDLHEGTDSTPPHTAGARLRREILNSGREAEARSAEAEALSAQLSAEIDEYNRAYDEFLVSLERHLAEQVARRSVATEWLWERQRHNSDVNQRNAEGKSISHEQNLVQAERIIWVNDMQRWRDDVNRYLGDLVIDEVQRKAIAKEMDNLVWKDNDEQLVGIQFELLCTDLLNQIGYSAAHEGGHDDRGIDIRASEFALTGQAWICLVQCRYKGLSGVVGENEVSQFIGKLSVAGDYNRALFMTAGVFHDDAVSIAESNGIDYWDGHKLFETLIAEQVGLEDTVSTAGHNIRFDTDYWEELRNRALVVRNSRRGTVSRPSESD